MLGLRKRRTRRGAGMGFSAAAMAAIFAIQFLAALQPGRFGATLAHAVAGRKKYVSSIS